MNAKAVSASWPLVRLASAADNAVVAFVVNAGRIRRPWPTSRTCGAAGQDFPDALSAGAAAGSYNAFGAIFGVVVPTNNDLMPSATESYLDTFLDHIGHLTAFLSAIGGQAEMALMDAGWSDFDLEGGSNRYDTAMNVAHEFFGGNRTVGVTAGLNWPASASGQLRPAAARH